MKLLTTLLISSAFAASAASATTIDLTRNSTQGATAQLFNEATNAVVNDFVNVDFVVGDNLSVGTLTNGIDEQGSPVQLGAGTYKSFLIHFDPDIDQGAASTSGSFDFIGKIVAIVLSNKGSGQLLNSTDSVFGTASYSYEQHIGRRAESNDTFTLDDINTLSFSLTANSSHIDNIRVITEVAPVPVPASMSLLLAGVGGFAALRRRKKA